MAIELGKFIDEWSRSAAHERANFQPFIIELCELLGVEKPDKAGPVESLNAYVFERAVTFSAAISSGLMVKGGNRYRPPHCCYTLAAT